MSRSILTSSTAFASASARRALSYRGRAGSGSIGSCLRDNRGPDRNRDAQQDDREDGVGIEVVAGEIDRGTGEAEGELVALSALLGRNSSRDPSPSNRKLRP